MSVVAEVAQTADVNHESHEVQQRLDCRFAIRAQQSHVELETAGSIGIDPDAALRGRTESFQHKSLGHHQPVDLTDPEYGSAAFSIDIPASPSYMTRDSQIHGTWTSHRMQHPFTIA